MQSHTCVSLYWYEDSFLILFYSCRVLNYMDILWFI